MDLQARAKALSVDDIVAMLTEREQFDQKLLGLSERVDAMAQQMAQQQVEMAQQQVEMAQQQIELEQARRQLDWFRRQVFGARSERRILDLLPRAEQMWLGEEMLDVPEEPPEPHVTVGAYERSHRRNPIRFTAKDSRLQFDEKIVPVVEIRLPNPELTDLAPEEIQEIREQHTYRLAQRSEYVVLKYIQQVVKRLDTGKMITPPAPAMVMPRSIADVSFLAGMVVDKFQHHLPLYRQHQRLEQAGVYLHRGTLTRLVHRLGQLLEPIYNTLKSSVLLSAVLAVDESPTPAEVSAGKPGKMKTGYFWSFVGDQREVAFYFAPTRSRRVLDEVLVGFEGTLLTDGYGVYESYVQSRQGKVVHAQCWVHTRRYFFEAERFMPEKTGLILRAIQQLYDIEAKVAGPDLAHRLQARQNLSTPIVDEIFALVHAELEHSVLLPSNPFMEALKYAAGREQELRVFLDDPTVPMDTNHVERTLRPPAVGRKNWMFHVTDVGARYGAIFYSLIETCKLQGVNARTYLIDILRRHDTHPAADVHLLTPRYWAEHFGHDPLRSDVDLPR